MIKLIRMSLVLFAIVPAGTIALTGTSGVAAARSSHADHKDSKVHKDRDGKHERSHHRKKHKKRVVCITAPCPGDGDRKRHASDDARKKEKCGTLILPTAGCGTPARDPVGNTRPTLPERQKQPLADGRQPVIENLR